MLNAGKQVFMYFCERRISPFAVNAEEIARVTAFRKSINQKDFLIAILLNRIQIRAVRGKIHEHDSGAGQKRSDFLYVVDARIIHNDNIPQFQRGNQRLFQVFDKLVASRSSGIRRISHGTVQTHRRENRCVFDLCGETARKACAQDELVS